LIDPTETFEDELLSAMIALGVGLLLFEGGLSLRWTEIGSTTRSVVVRLLTIGVLVTLVMAAAAALVLTDLPRGVAVLFGTIMVVTGPTVVIISTELNKIKHFIHTFHAFRLGHTFDHQSVCDVIPDVHVREQGIILENSVDIALKGRQIRDILTIKINTTGGWLIKTRDHSQTGCFTGTGRPQQGKELPITDFNICLVYGFDWTKVSAYIFK
jgi:hypothetical protein